MVVASRLSAVPVAGLAEPAAGVTAPGYSLNLCIVGCFRLLEGRLPRRPRGLPRIARPAAPPRGSVASQAVWLFALRLFLSFGGTASTPSGLLAVSAFGCSVAGRVEPGAVWLFLPFGGTASTPSGLLARRLLARRLLAVSAFGCLAVPAFWRDGFHAVHDRKKIRGPAAEESTANSLDGV